MVLNISLSAQFNRAVDLGKKLYFPQRKELYGGTPTASGGDLLFMVL
jgi:hypothetical protein